MKRKYQAPETFVETVLWPERQLLTASREGRLVGGGPTDTGSTPNVPIPVSNATDGDDGMQEERGQGSGGTGTRGKEFDLWDISAFSIWE